MDVFLRARGTPILVQHLARECPLPEGVPGKYIKVLASDERFELQDLKGAKPMVQMRVTLPMTEATAASVAADRKKWLSGCVHFSELRSMHCVEPLQRVACAAAVSYHAPRYSIVSSLGAFFCGTAG